MNTKINNVKKALQNMQMKYNIIGSRTPEFTLVDCPTMDELEID